MTETVRGSKLFVGCSLWTMDAYLLLGVNLKLNTLCKEECLGREGLLAKPSRCFLSMENSVLGLHDYR